ncbi:hypothetical protein K2173_009319 [Erythroxylum novogranatense]|uniref:FAS1 domain-containing protein n=1 Tax=Erythroxylum novogranatense TaxID=1862640 RepID=A0AAV8U6C8_9ROSI|nr:hypothetical protein K2173_009319 [Erythroxylum novogranatense]
MSLINLFSVLALSAIYFGLFSVGTAFNITTILDKQPDFSSFNQFLTQTQVANAINSRQTITVLAVDNGNAASLSGQSADKIKAVMSLHVILDYYDTEKLKNLPNKGGHLTTLYQASGLARGQEGFLNVTKSNGGIAFGSAAPGSNPSSSLIKTLASQPYNISVLQVSSLIIPSTNSTNSPPSPPPPPTSAPSKSPSGSPPAKPPSGKAPAPSKGKAPAPSPPNGEAPAPANADTPTADTPTASPPASDTPSPMADGPGSDSAAPTADKAGAPALYVNRLCILVMASLAMALI